MEKMGKLRSMAQRLEKEQARKNPIEMGERRNALKWGKTD